MPVPFIGKTEEDRGLANNELSDLVNIILLLETVKIFKSGLLLYNAVQKNRTEKVGCVEKCYLEVDHSKRSFTARSPGFWRSHP
jgi:hypothetical protein